MTGTDTTGDRDAAVDRPAVTGAPIGGSRTEAITGDDAVEPGADAYPVDGVAPDRGSSAPRD